MGLDTMLDVGGETKSIAEHLADAIADPGRRGPFARAIAATRSALEVAELCVESPEVPDSDAVIAELLAACGDDVVGVLRDFAVDRRLAAPWLLVLAHRDPAPPPRRLEQLASLVDTIDPLVEAGLHTLALDRRAPLVIALYDRLEATADKHALEVVMLAAPYPLYARSLLARVAQLREAYYDEGGVPAKLVVHIRAYAERTRDRGFAAAIERTLAG